MEYKKRMVSETNNIGQNEIIFQILNLEIKVKEFYLYDKFIIKKLTNEDKRNILSRFNLDQKWFILSYAIKRIDRKYTKYKTKFFKKKSSNIESQIRMDLLECLRRLKFLLYLNQNCDPCMPFFYAKINNSDFSRNFEDNRRWLDWNFPLKLRNNKNRDELKSFIRKNIKLKLFESEYMFFIMNEFERTYESINWKEIIVKLFIILEGLYLEENTELKFRLSILVSAFLSDNKKEKIKLHEFIKKGYDVRSYIVHGRDELTIHKQILKCPLLFNHPKLNSIQNFIWNLRNIVRLSFIKILKLSKTTSNPREIRKLIVKEIF